MKIRIVQDGCDGNFTVGETYDVTSTHGMFVYAIDNDGSTEAIYSYQYEVAQW